jgi:4-amino-4-deoxy-L-arabinose transferase-like glycosyltransferase
VDRGLRRLVLCGLLALAVRLVYVLVIARAPVGVGGDAGFYESAANLAAHGHFYYRTILGGSYPTAEHPPLFSLVLAAVSWFGGDTLIAHRITGCVIGSVAVVLIGLVGTRVAGSRAGLIAALIAAFYPPLVTADALVMSEPLFVALVAVALLVAIRAHVRGGLMVAAGLGAVLALTTLTRGEGILLVPLLGWPAVWGTARGRAGRLVVLTAAVVLVLTPWIVRNVVVFHRVMLAADASTLIAGANCPDTYYGHDTGWWSLGCLQRARTPDQLHSGDASTDAAFTYAGNHVNRLALVAVVRVARTFDLYQPMRQGNLEPRRSWVDVAGLVFYFPLLMLAVVGLVRLRGWRWLLLAPVTMVIIVSLLGWGIGRFRVAADISILVLAASVLAGGLGLRSPRAGRSRHRSVAATESTLGPARR